jgi:hypothetical protein
MYMCRRVAARGLDNTIVLCNISSTVYVAADSHDVHFLNRDPSTHTREELLRELRRT